MLMVDISTLKKRVQELEVALAAKTAEEKMLQEHVLVAHKKVDVMRKDVEVIFEETAHLRTTMLESCKKKLAILGGEVESLKALLEIERAEKRKAEQVVNVTCDCVNIPAYGIENTELNLRRRRNGCWHAISSASN